MKKTMNPERDFSPVRWHIELNDLIKERIKSINKTYREIEEK
jgi:hypothetical protein